VDSKLQSDTVESIGMDDILDPTGGATHQTDKDRRLLQDKEGSKIDGKDGGIWPDRR